MHLNGAARKAIFHRWQPDFTLERAVTSSCFCVEGTKTEIILKLSPGIPQKTKRLKKTHKHTLTHSLTHTQKIGRASCRERV